MDNIINVIKDYDIKGYPEFKFGYYILGLDIMLNDTFENAYLLEINTHIGHRFNTLSIEYDRFSKDYLEWEFNSVVKPIFTQIEFVPIHKINDNQLDQLLKLTMNRKLMKGIGIGDIWDKNHLLKMITDSKNEEDIDDIDKKYFDWFVIHKYSINNNLNNNYVLGYVGMRPMTKYKINGKELKLEKNDTQARILTIPS
jgi:hypothetical protein